MCPTCKEDWADDAVVPIGEAAARDGQDARRRVRRSDINGSEAGDRDESQEEPSQTSAQSQSQTQGKTGKAKALVKGVKKTNHRRGRKKWVAVI